jgi:hypothetical protein
MAADYNKFWRSVSVLAETFRNDDPQIVGNVLELAEHLRSLSPERQSVIRSDLQLLLAHFTKLPLALATHHECYTVPVKLDCPSSEPAHCDER